MIAKNKIVNLNNWIKNNTKLAIDVFELKKFEIGQSNPTYLMKTDTPKGKKPVCVSIPKGTDVDTLTAQQAGEIFEAGMKAKAKGGFRKFKKN